MDYDKSGRIRNGFTSFWLILCLVYHLLSLVMYLFRAWMGTGGIVNFLVPLSITLRYGILLLSSAVLVVVSVIGIIFILRWKMIGFILWMGSSIVNIFLGMMRGERLNIIAIAAGIVVMLIVINLRKNEKSTFDQLE